MSSSIRLQLLGSFKLEVDGCVIELSPIASRMLAILALEGTVTRAQLAGLLWPEKNECRARANLRSTLLRLRTAGVNAVEEGSLFALSLVKNVLLDLPRGPKSAEGEVLDLDTLLSELLPDWSEPWLELHRMEWRQTRLHEIDLLCARHLAAGRWTAARCLAERALEVEPLRESLICQLVEACVRQGDVDSADAKIQEYRQLLDTKIGMAPSRQFELVERCVAIAGS